MKFTLPIIFAVTLSSSLISHASPDITVPDMFNDGPIAPTTIKLKTSEITSIALLKVLWK